jgi:hypothetical protein
MSHLCYELEKSMPNALQGPPPHVSVWPSAIVHGIAANGEGREWARRGAGAGASARRVTERCGVGAGAERAARARGPRRARRAAQKTNKGGNHTQNLAARRAREAFPQPQRRPSPRRSSREPNRRPRGCGAPRPPRVSRGPPADALSEFGMSGIYSGHAPTAATCGHAERRRGEGGAETQRRSVRVEAVRTRDCAGAARLPRARARGHG